MVIVYVVALLLQVAGSVVAVIEVRETYKHWHQQFRSPRTVRMGAAIDGLTGSFTAETEAVRAPETVEERLDRIEAEQKARHDALREQIATVERAVPEQAEQTAHAVEQRLAPQISETFQYLARQGERSKWMPWWLGLALVLAGTLLGGVADVITAWSSSV